MIINLKVRRGISHKVDPHQALIVRVSVLSFIVFARTEITLEQATACIYAYLEKDKASDYLMMPLADVASAVAPPELLRA